MQLRPLSPADLELIDEIDGTISSDRYLFVERHADGLSATLRVEERRHATVKVEANAIDDELRFSLNQVAAGIEDGIAMVAEHDGVPIASMLAMLTADRSVVALVDVRVDFERRRDGLGSAMVFQAINHAREIEARAVRAMITSNNAPACALLAKLGFELAGVDTMRASNHDLVKERSTLVWYLALR